jgi:hypothetical protein
VTLKDGAIKQIEVTKKKISFMGNERVAYIVNDLTSVVVEKQAQAMEQCS